MTEQQYPETGIREETRQMYPDNYTDKLGIAMNNLIDEIVRPNHIPPKKHDHSILLDELAIMYEANISKGGDQQRFNASVLRAAINVILTCTK